MQRELPGYDTRSLHGSPRIRADDDLGALPGTQPNAPRLDRDLDSAGRSRGRPDGDGHPAGRDVLDPEPSLDPEWTAHGRAERDGRRLRDDLLLNRGAQIEETRARCRRVEIHRPRGSDEESEQAGGAGPVQANLSGTDTVIIATVVKKFSWWIFSQPNITRMEDLKGKVFGTTRFGTQSDLASRIALRRFGIDPERDITMVQTGGPAETVAAMVAGKVHAAAITPPMFRVARRSMSTIGPTSPPIR